MPAARFMLPVLVGLGEGCILPGAKLQECEYLMVYKNTPGDASGEPSEFYLLVCELIRERVESFGWTYRELAEATGVPVSVCWRLINGGRIHSDSFIKIIGTIGIDLVEGVPVPEGGTA